MYFRRAANVADIVNYTRTRPSSTDDGTIDDMIGFVSDIGLTVFVLIKAKFHYASWFGASSELANVMEFDF